MHVEACVCRHKCAGMCVEICVRVCVHMETHVSMCVYGGPCLYVGLCSCILCPKWHLQRVGHGAPLQRLTVPGRVDKHEGDGGSDGGDEYGLDHLQAGPVYVPAANRSVQGHCLGPVRCQRRLMGPGTEAGGALPHPQHSSPDAKHRQPVVEGVEHGAENATWAEGACEGTGKGVGACPPTGTKEAAVQRRGTPASGQWPLWPQQASPRQFLLVGRGSGLVGGGVCTCAQALPSTPMAMKMGISWMVYTMVWGEEARVSQPSAGRRAAGVLACP